MAGGRPTDYCQQIADDICERLLDGESLRTICASEDMPARSTVMRWLGLHKEFSDQYARTKQEQAEALADEIVEIADEEVTMIKASKHGVKADDEDGNVEVAFDPTAVARNRLRVDARKWVAAKLLPKKYGERSQMELSGANGGPLEVTVSLVKASG